MKTSINFFLLVISFLLSSNLSFSQTNNHLVVSGRVLDKNTQEPLPYATVGIVGTTIGMATNELGEFIINIPKSNIKDTLVVSILGYLKFAKPVSTLSENEIIELEERIFTLDEITIGKRNKKVTGSDILKEINRNEKINFPDNDYSLATFFRETYQLNDEYFQLLEAAATIYGKGFPKIEKDVYIDEIRIAPGTTPSLPLSIGENYNPFQELQRSTGRLQNVKACPKCEYEVQEYLFNDGNLVGVIVSEYISEDSSYQSKFKYTIDMEDYAILEFDFETIIPFGQGFPETLQEKYNSSLTYLKRKSSYRKHNGKYYLSQYFQNLRHTYKAINSNETYTSEHRFHLFTNLIEINPEVPEKEVESMSYSNNLKANAKKYNKEFWQNYNVLKQTPLDKRIILDLEKKNNSLEVQFNSTKE